jgi:hypothetical protein
VAARVARGGSGCVIGGGESVGVGSGGVAAGAAAVSLPSSFAAFFSAFAVPPFAPVVL